MDIDLLLFGLPIVLLLDYCQLDDKEIKGEPI